MSPVLETQEARYLGEVRSRQLAGTCAHLALDRCSRGFRLNWAPNNLKATSLLWWVRESRGAWVCISQADECSVNPELPAWDLEKKKKKPKRRWRNESLWVERRLSVFDGLDGVRLNI